MEYRNIGGEMLHFTFAVTPFFSTYDCEAEHTLSAPDISLGSILSLSEQENPTLHIHSQAFGPSSTIAWLYRHIARLNAASGASNSMDAESILLCARDIITNFPWITMGEFCVFCSRFRAHRYVCKRSDYIFSSDIIMQGIREYLVDRREAKEKWEREHKPAPDYSNCITFDEAARSGILKNLSSIGSLDNIASSFDVNKEEAQSREQKRKIVEDVKKKLRSSGVMP